MSASDLDVADRTKFDKVKSQTILNIEIVVALSVCRDAGSETLFKSFLCPSNSDLNVKKIPVKGATKILLSIQ